MNYPIRERHYRRISGLTPRTEGDQTQEFMSVRSSITAFTRIDRAKPQRPSLISTSEGSIDRLLFTIPTYAVQGLATAYQDIFKNLPATTRIVVLVHEETRSTVENWISNAGLDAQAEVVSAPNHIHFSIWAEDGYAVSKDIESGKTYFVEPFSFPRYGDSLIADFISNSTDLEDTQASVYFQGGNILIGDNFFMIGADYPAKSLEYTKNHLVPREGESAFSLVHRLYIEYLDTSRDLIYVGSSIPVPKERRDSITLNGQQWEEILYFGNKDGTSQPLFHIDMFISLAGRNEKGNFQLLVGDPSVSADLLGIPVVPHAMREVFDNIAQFLRKKGFEVIRNPLPLVYVDDVQRKRRTWYFATSNNLLVQNEGGNSKVVWMPTYGHGSWPELSATDDVNAEIWESLGFEVRRLGDFHPFAENLGALHCIKKFLARSGQVLTK